MSAMIRTATVFLLMVVALWAKAPSSDDGSKEQWLQVQVFLDDAGFRPGVIDGLEGEFTKKALARYFRAQGKELPAGEIAPEQLGLPIDAASSALTDYQITESDASAVGPVATEPPAQAKLKKLAYGSVAEAVAEKFHTKVELLKKLNPKAAWKAGETVQVPKIATPFDLDAVEKLKAANAKKKSKKETNEEESTEMAIVIDTTEKMLDLLSADRVIASYPITPGSERLPAPTGEWTIERITWLPPFRWDKEMLLKGKRGSNAFDLPPGPNSPVGIVWMALNKDGIGIHGTNEPDTIGRSTSHGCIRLSNWDAFDLGQKVRAKTKVTIR